ncbi:MAG: hypothetical protein NT003_00650 [Candidatus Magasanikbacteria bacterium]|nr:hypothetical protein [Candidatus Magasanikbacteria bacterium]
MKAIVKNGNNPSVAAICQAVSAWNNTRPERSCVVFHLVGGETMRISVSGVAHEGNSGTTLNITGSSPLGIPVKVHYNALPSFGGDSIGRITSDLPVQPQAPPS